MWSASGFVFLFFNPDLVEDEGGSVGSGGDATRPVVACQLGGPPTGVPFVSGVRRERALLQRGFNGYRWRERPPD